MEITLHDAMTVLHGMFFGALLLLALAGVALVLYATATPTNPWRLTPAQNRMLTSYVTLTACLAWATVLIGAYLIYPWYRARPPAGVIDLSGYPQRLLMSSASTTGWHDLGMEWKEHIAWFAPLSLTTVAFLFARYGTRLHALASLRRAVFALVALAFVSASVAGFFGAMLNKYAPVRGGPNIVLMHGDAHAD
jgi:hypothetical protein